MFWPPGFGAVLLCSLAYTENNIKVDLSPKCSYQHIRLAAKLVGPYVAIVFLEGLGKSTGLTSSAPTNFVQIPLGKI